MIRRFAIISFLLATIHPGLALSQSNCSVPTATPVQIRAEGATELLADLTFTCIGSGGTANLQIFLAPSLPVTSKIVSAGTGATEATLSTSAGSTQGTVSGSAVNFLNFQLPSGTATVTVTNVRINAISLVVNGSGTRVSETLFISGPGVVAAALAPMVTGIVSPGLAGPASQSAAIAACSSLSATSGPSFLVRFSESFPTAFKAQGGIANSTLGSPFTGNTENGFYISAGTGNLVNSATRVRVVFTNIPAGTLVYVPLTLTANGVSGSPTTLRMTASETGSFSPVTAASGAGVPASPQVGVVSIASGSGAAVYEVTSQDAATIDDFIVPVYLTATAAALTGAANPVTATVGFAPVGSSNIPNFANSGTIVVTAPVAGSCIPLSIAPATISAARIGVPYLQWLSAGSVTAWSISGGTLPAGLTLNATTGAITGTPTVSGSFPITVRATDSSNNQFTKAYSLSVSGPLTITTTTLPPGATTTPYGQTLATTGGSGTLNWSVVSGLDQLQAAGITLNASTGRISGTPGVAGTFAFTIKALDTDGTSATQALTLVVNQAPVSCTGSFISNTNIIRGEGVTEQTGGISFNCSGSGGVADFQVFLSPALPITSKILDPVSGATEATLTTTAGSTQGTIDASGTSVTFKNTTIPSGTPTVNISNIRVNATSLNIGAGVPPAISATIFSSGGVPSVLTPASVSFVVNGLGTQTVTGVTNYSTCSPAQPGTGPAMTVNFAENFAQAFRARATETATFVTVGGVNNQANSGTRISVTFANVPANLSIYMPVALNSGNGAAGTLAMTTSSTGLFSAVAAVTPTVGNGLPASPGLALLTVSGSTATAVYEVTAEDLSNLERYSVPVYFASAGSIAPQTNLIGIVVAFAPTGSQNVPRFAVTSSSTQLAGSGFSFCPVISGLPIMRAGSSYNGTLTVSGGTGPYTFSNAVLPAGLSMSASGVITGTVGVNVSGTFAASVTVTDANGVSTRVLFSLQSITTLNITRTSLPAGWLNEAFPAVTLTVQNSVIPMTWSVSAGALPTGMNLNPTTGVVSGTPTVAGVYTFTAKATDSSIPAQMATQSFTFTVARQYVSSTIAGAVPVPTPVAAVNASFAGGMNAPPILDAAGNVYFADSNSVYRVSLNGTLTRVAGNGRPGYSGDGGAATSAQLWQPQQLAFDAAGNLFIADLNNGRVRRVSTAGIITTVAGRGSAATGPGAPGLTLAGPGGLTFDPQGNLYFTDVGLIRKMTPGGMVSSFFLDFVNFPVIGQLASDANGNIYIYKTSAVYRISPAGAITTFAGTPGTAGISGDGGPATAAKLGTVSGVTTDSAGNVYIADSGNTRIRKVTPAGTISPVGGVNLGSISRLATDSTGNFYTVVIGQAQRFGFNLNQLVKIPPVGSMTAFAGNGTAGFSGDGDTAISAQLGASLQAATDPSGNVYVADSTNLRIRRIATDGTIATVAGSGMKGDTGDGGPALAAKLQYPSQIAADAFGNVFLSDVLSNRVRKFTPGGGIDAFAFGAAPPLLSIAGLATDAAGNVYIADSADSRIRKVDVSGAVSTAAGTGSTGFSGDGGASTAAALSSPRGVAVDAGGRILIADQGNQRIRAVSAGGTISTIAGTGSSGYTGDGGQAAAATFSAPAGMAADSVGNVFVVDLNNSAVRRISASGVINTILVGVSDFPLRPDSVATDAAGNVYVADSVNAAIRKLTPSSATPLLISTASVSPVAVNTAYPATSIAVSGGTAGYTWSVPAIALPPGMTLNSATGAISGTPTAQGAYDFTVAVTDSGTVATTGTPAQVISQNFRIYVTGPPSVLTTSLPAGIAGLIYPGATLTATLGTPPYTWTVSAGTLPAGLLLNASTGVISGTPITAGTVNITVTATDSATPPLSAASQSIALTISPSLTISSTTLPNAIQYIAYSGATLVAANGSGALTWSVVGSALPTGLSLSASTGAVSGTATVTGSFAVTFQVTDSGVVVQTATKQLTLRVATPLTLISTIAGVARNSPFSLSLAQGGTPPYSCTINVGEMWPAGLTLNATTCVVSGTPTSAMGRNVTVTVTDSAVPAQTASRNYPIPVSNPVQITTSALPLIPAVGNTYSATLAAAGGYPGYSSWMLTSGVLPNGFTLNAGTGVISGNPGAVSGGPFTFSISVQDSAGNVSAPRAYSTAPLTATATTLSFSAGPTVAGQSVTLTATVVPAAPGKVTFYDGTTVLGTATTASGIATLSTALLPVGTRSVRAYFLGGSGYAAGTSASVSKTISPVLQGGLRQPASVAGAALPYHPVSGDFNGDGKLDLAFGTSTGVSVLAGNGDGTFQPAVTSAGGGSAVATGDFNGDGKLDLVLVTTPFSIARVMLGNGDGTFQAAVDYGIVGFGNAVAVGDFNGDGNADIVAGHMGGFSLLLGNGDGSFYLAPASVGLGEVFNVVVGDFNRDGIADLASTSTSASRTVVYLGNGDGTFQAGADYGVGGISIAVVDLNSDGFPDLATSNGVRAGAATGVFGALNAYPGSLTGSPVAGDFNADGKPDLMLLKGGTASVLPGVGDGTFGAALTYATGATSLESLLADYNGDGLADLVILTRNNITIQLGVAPLTITCTPATGPTLTATAYSASCPATGGASPFTWAISGGTLPAGLSLNATTGMITGTPVATGTYAYTVRVTDSSAVAQSVTQAFNGTLSQPVVTPPGGGGGGGGGFPAGSTLTAAPTAMTFAASPGNPPAGQSFALTSTITGSTFNTNAVTNQGAGWLSVSPASGSTDSQGTLTVSVNPTGLGQGTYTGTVNASSDKGGIASVAVTLNVQAAITATPASLSFTFSQGDSQLPATQGLSVFSMPTGVAFSASAANVQGENWLRVSNGVGTTSAAVGVSVNTTNLSPGTYNASVTIASAAANTVSVPVTLTVVKAAPKLSLSPLSSNLAVTAAGTASGQVTVSNTGGGALQFTATAATDQGNWLTLSGSAGTTTPSSPASLSFAADAGGLTPGLYAGRITVKDLGSSVQAVVQVMLAVSQGAQSMSLSQTGLTLSAVAGGLRPPAQQFTIVGQGTGSLGWSLQPQTVPNPLADRAWLSALPGSGASVGGQPGTVANVSVDPTGLPAGQYFGAVSVNAPNAVNNPQSVAVVLNVAAANQTGTPITLSRGGVILQGAAGSRTSQQQTVTLFNPSNAAVNFSTTVFSAAGGWLSANPATGTALPGNTTLTIQGDFSGLPGGLQSGTVRVSFENGMAGSVTVLALAGGGVSGNAVSGLQPRAAGAFACAGGKAGYLVPVFRQPQDQAMLQAAIPQTVQLQIIDDCGAAVSQRAGGNVQVGFGNSDASLDLRDTGGGIWEGTWNPVKAGGTVSMQVSASQGSLSSTGTGISVTVQAAAGSGPAQISGVVNAASAGQATPQIVTPGSYVAIYGNGLAGGAGASATTIPLPTLLNGTQLFLGDQKLPLLYAGAAQVNALIPRNLNANTSYQLVVQRGSTRSVGMPLTVAALQPGIYSADLTGGGQGVVSIAGTSMLAAPTGATGRPAVRGVDYLVVYCTGLGPVAGPNGEAGPTDGAGAPLTAVYRTVAKVTATLGGVDAPVVFSGLTPSLVGLYQVNVQVPAGVPAGSAAPLTIRVGDSVSNSVSVALQ